MPKRSLAEAVRGPIRAVRKALQEVGKPNLPHWWGMVAGYNLEMSIRAVRELIQAHGEEAISDLVEEEETPFLIEMCKITAEMWEHAALAVARRNGPTVKSNAKAVVALLGEFTELLKLLTSKLGGNAEETVAAEVETLVLRLQELRQQTEEQCQNEHPARNNRFGNRPWIAPGYK